jgi:pre-rRNA-processing protein TSR2
MSQPEPPTSPTILLFARGVIALLDLWPALTIAVTEQWGGPDSLAKKTWLASIIIDEFESHATFLPSPNTTASPSSSTAPRVDPTTATKPPLDHDDLADSLNQVMSDEFEANIEDGSIDAVSADIIRLWRDILSATPEAIVEALERKAGEVRRSGVQATKGGDIVEVDDDEDTSGSGREDEVDVMEIDETPQPVPRDTEKEERTEPVVDDDGFTLVQGKGRRR